MSTIIVETRKDRRETDVRAIAALHPPRTPARIRRAKSDPQSQTAIYRNVGTFVAGGENGSAESRREYCCYGIQALPRCNSFTDKFRRAKHRSQCSILLIGVFAGGIRFNSRMRWVDISLEVSWAVCNGWRLFPYPYPEKRSRAKNLPVTRHPLPLILIFARCLLLTSRTSLARALLPRRDARKMPNGGVVSALTSARYRAARCVPVVCVVKNVIEEVSFFIVLSLRLTSKGAP